MGWLYESYVLDSQYWSTVQLPLKLRLRFHPVPEGVLNDLANLSSQAGLNRSHSWWKLRKAIELLDNKLKRLQINVHLVHLFHSRVKIEKKREKKGGKEIGWELFNYRS